MLAARLLNKAPVANRIIERQQDQRIKLALLRELRFREVRGKRELYARIIQHEELVDVVEMALLDAMALDAIFLPAMLCASCLAMALPRIRRLRFFRCVNFRV